MTDRARYLAMLSVDELVLYYGISGEFPAQCRDLARRNAAMDIIDGASEPRRITRARLVWNGRAGRFLMRSASSPRPVGTEAA